MIRLADTICGLDEAGRGVFAGPLVCAAVVLPASFTRRDFPTGFTFADSKKMSEKQREKTFEAIEHISLNIAIATVGVEFINEYGIGVANRQAFECLVAELPADRYIVDGNLRFTDSQVESVVRADGFIPSVMCAGIVAKVWRDRLMKQLVEADVFGFGTNKGYGTASHQQVLLKHGMSGQHRSAFVSTFFKKQANNLALSN